MRRWGGWLLIWDNEVAETVKNPDERTIREMQLSQIQPMAATFDERNLLTSAGLIPVVHLARRAGLHTLVADKLTIDGGTGSNAAAKVASMHRPSSNSRQEAPFTVMLNAVNAPPKAA